MASVVVFMRRLIARALISSLSDWFSLLYLFELLASLISDMTEKITGNSFLLFRL